MESISFEDIKELFPEYKDYKKYGAIAAMTFDEDVLEEAEEYLKIN